MENAIACVSFFVGYIICIPFYCLIGKQFKGLFVKRDTLNYKSEESQSVTFEINLTK